MACSSCAQKRAQQTLLSRGYTEASFSVGGEDLVLVLYTSPNIAMHQIPSYVGAMINGKPANYGRHRGAHKEELALYEAGELTVEKAREIKTIPFAIFWVHPLEIEARSDLFKPLLAKLPKSEPEAEETAEERVIPEAEVSFSVQSLPQAQPEKFEHKYLTKKVRESMLEAGVPASSVFLASADVTMLSEYFRKSGRVTAESKAISVIEAAKAAVE